MSDKMNGSVWDIPCPADYNGATFKPNHKFVLLAYADHADHFGKNIYPAVMTIVKKTGYEERSVQRITRDLEDMGFLVPDGHGPHGTNKWFLPLDRRGDKITPLLRGDKMTPNGGDIPSGDIPSGDIPSGDKMTPELIKEEYILNYLNGYFAHEKWWSRFQKEIENAKLDHTTDMIVISGLGTKAEEMQERYGATMKRLLSIAEYENITFTE